MRFGSNHFYHLQECFKDIWYICKFQRRSFSYEGFDHFVLIFRHTNTYFICRLKKVPIHGMLFVTMVSTEVKSPGFHFLKKEYSFVYATVQFDLLFSNTAWCKNTLNTTMVLYRFRRINSLNLLDFKAYNSL